MLVAMGHLNGPVLEFLVLFAVILLGPLVVMRFGLPGLIGLVLGGFAIGAHGFNLIHAGDQTVPELGQLGLL
jgi:Kef-type K+ transport system membrane component KefB